jgi:exodeoxyribonuclease VII large subunit
LAQRLDGLDGQLHSALRYGQQSRRQQLTGLEQRLRAASPVQRLARAKDRTSALTQRLRRASPLGPVAAHHQQIAHAETALRDALAHRQERLAQRLALAAQGLHLQSPLGTVARGYAVLTTEPEAEKRFGMVIKSPDAVAPGTRLQATLAGGTLAVITEGPVNPSKP